MTRLAYPGPGRPAPPRVALTVPPDWEPVWVEDTLLAARRCPDGSGRECAIEVRCRGGMPAAPVAIDVAERLARHLADAAVLPGAAASPEFAVEFAGRTYRGVNRTWTQPDGTAMVGADLFGALDDDGVRWSVWVSGRVRADRAAQDFPVLQDVMASLVVEPSPAGEPGYPSPAVNGGVA